MDQESNNSIQRRRSPPLNINPVLSPLGNSNGSPTILQNSNNINNNAYVSPLKGYSSTQGTDPINRLRSSPEPTCSSPNKMHTQPQPRSGRVRSNSRSTGSQYISDFDQQFNTSKAITTDSIDLEKSINATDNKRSRNHSHHNTNESNRTVTNDSKSRDNSISNLSKKIELTDNANRMITSTTIPPSSLTSRNKYTHIVILKSLNGTFETKFLMIPFKPDILKLGRPVVNNNNNNNSSSNNNPIGRNGSNKNANNGNGINNSDNSRKNASSLVRPDNGNFDSRVLSRNHACLTCDPKTGKIYIKDLKSSNGTFINGNRIDQNEVELKVGDVIDLGTDIDTKFEHRKISAFVEEITIIPLINGSESTEQNEIHEDKPNIMRKKIEPISISPQSAQRAAFEAAMFGDVNNLDLEDAILGPETEILSGIFINNSIGTSPQLMNVIKMLSTELSLEKQEYAKLKSMENFMVNYTTNLEYINKLMIEMNDKQLVKLQETLKKTFIDKQERVIRETKEQIIKMNKEREVFKNQYLEEIKENKNSINSLEMEIEALKTRLEVEKYKNSQLLKKSNKHNCAPVATDDKEKVDVGFQQELQKEESPESKHNTENGEDLDQNNKQKIPLISEEKRYDKSVVDPTNPLAEPSISVVTSVNIGDKDNTGEQGNSSEKFNYFKKIPSVVIITAISVGIVAIILKSKFN